MNLQLIEFLFTALGPKLITALGILAKDKGKSASEITIDEINALGDHLTPGQPNAPSLNG